MEKKFDLSSLRLDETGRVEVDATKLAALNESQNAGGIDVFSATDDPNLINWFFCDGTRNAGEACINGWFCDNTTNESDCRNSRHCDDSKNSSPGC